MNQYQMYRKTKPLRRKIYLAAVKSELHQPRSKTTQHLFSLLGESQTYFHDKKKVAQIGVRFDALHRRLRTQLAKKSKTKK